MTVAGARRTKVRLKENWLNVELLQTSDVVLLRRSWRQRRVLRTVLYICEMSIQHMFVDVETLKTYVIEKVE